MRLRNSPSLTVLLVLSSPLLAQLPEDLAKGVPEEIRSIEPPRQLPRNEVRTIQPPSEYLWLSAAAIDKAGLDLLPTPTKDFIQRLFLTARDANCVEIGPTIVDIARGQAILRTFDDLVRASKTIVEGTVNGVRGGFYRETPGFLLSVDVESVLVSEGDPHVSVGTQILAFHPGPGFFTLLERPICVRDPRFPRLPAPGDHLMIFSPRVPLNPAAPVNLSEENVIVRRQNGSIELPKKLAKDAVLAGAEDFAALREDVMRRRIK